MPSHTWNFPPVRKGSPLGDICGADYHNAIRHALKWVDAERNRSGAGRANRAGADSGIVWILNASGAAAEAYSILGIDSTVPVTPTDNLVDFQCNHLLQGVTPAAGHSGKFVVCLEPIPNGAIGQAGAVGVFPCKVTASGSPVPDYADINAGSPASLMAADTGLARILWRESGTGAKWAIVRMGGGSGGGGGQWITFTADAAFTTSDASFSATVVTSFSAPDAAAATVTVNNTEGMFYGALGVTGIAVYDSASDAYYLWQLGCPAPA